VNPADADALLLVGILQCESGSLDRGRDRLHRATRLDPLNSQRLLNLVRAEERRRNVPASTAAILGVLVLSPAEVSAWSLRGRLELNEQGTDDVAAAAFLRVVSIDPANGEGHYFLAMSIKRLDGLSSAISSFGRSIALLPERAVFYVGYAEVLADSAKFLQAIDWYVRAQSLDPKNNDVPYWKSLTELRLGRFEDGWRNYESRWRSSVSTVHRSSVSELLESRPRFRISDTRKRVLAWAEQGVGDEIMFGGLLSDFRPMCSELLVKLDPRLIGLFRRSFPDIRFFEHEEPVSLDSYDEQLPLGSLGMICRPNARSFESGGSPYLTVRPGLAAKLRAELGIRQGERLIGLSWRSANPETRRIRSIDLESIVTKLRADGVRFLNLQYGNLDAEIESVAARTGVRVLSHPTVDTRDDLEGVAALIEACDLIVSVGNATAHLAGAVGQRTWVLLPHVAGWRWLHEGERCSWYQSVRLFRQTVRNDWSEVLVRVRKAFESEDFSA